MTGGDHLLVREGQRGPLVNRPHQRQSPPQHANVAKLPSKTTPEGKLASFANFNMFQYLVLYFEGLNRHLSKP